AWKGSSLFPFSKNVEEGKEQGLCSTGQGKEATVQGIQRGVLSNGGLKDPR
ncbi:hypothetical protein TNCT_42291, partial [Trichonephila clavata]